MRGRRFLHPKLGFTFTAPEGFTLDNTAQAVFGVKDSGAQALRLDVVRVPAEQTLPDYLTSGWIENVDAEDRSRSSTINGFPAATATAKGDQWTFRLYVVRFGSDVYRFIFAAKRPHRGGRPHLPRFAQHVPPHDDRRRRKTPSRCASSSSPSAPATPSSSMARRMADAPTTSASASACSTGSTPAKRRRRARRSRSWWSDQRPELLLRRRFGDRLPVKAHYEAKRSDCGHFRKRRNAAPAIFQRLPAHTIYCTEKKPGVFRALRGNR